MDFADRATILPSEEPLPRHKLTNYFACDEDYRVGQQNPEKSRGNLNTPYIDKQTNIEHFNVIFTLGHAS